MTSSGEVIERISPWAKYVVQNEQTKLMEPVFWNPPSPYRMKHKQPRRPRSLRIYESHVGIASDQYKVATYKEFKDDVLPYIKQLGMWFCSIF